AFMIVRFLVGVGEAASAPSANKLVANWIGRDQHGIGSSAFILGIGLGGALTPPIITTIMQRWGWRSSFYIAGVIGIVVVLIWYSFVTDRPEQHRRVNAEELALIRRGQTAKLEQVGATPWRHMLSHRSVWGVLLGYFCQG